MNNTSPLKMKVVGFGLVILLSLSTSCKLGKNFSRPEQPIPESFRNDFPNQASIANTPWWKLFGDTVLVELISTGINNNKNLRIAFSRINESGANMKIVRSNLYPFVNYGVTTSSTATTSASELDNILNGGVNISYEVNLWGKYRNLSDAAFQEYLASEDAYRALTITLIAEIANAYFLLRDLDNRLIISEKTASTWQSNLEIVEARFRGGFVSEVDVNQAKIQLTEAKTAIQTFTRLRAQTENAISLLLGLPPQSIPRGLELTNQVFSPEIPVGLPSELLDRRPDVLATERELHAQTLRIGAAEALRYPSLILSADMGAQFVQPALGFASLGTQILGPIFNRGANKARIKIEKERTIQLLNNYENTYLNALREVENAMIAVQTYENEFELRKSQVIAANDAARLSWVRYDGGLTSYLEVLDLQRSSFNSQLKASETYQNQLNSTVSLYQALGGGWVPLQDSLQLLK